MATPAIVGRRAPPTAMVSTDRCSRGLDGRPEFDIRHLLGGFPESGPLDTKPCFLHHVRSVYRRSFGSADLFQLTAFLGAYLAARTTEYL